MIKKLVLGALVLGCVGNVAMAEDYVTRHEFNQVANDVYDLHNDQIMLHLQQQKEIDQLKKTQYDNTSIKNEIANVNNRIDNLPVYDDTEIVKQIDTIKESNDKLQGQVENNTTLLNSVQGQLQEFKSETRSGIASAIAIAGLEKPVYDSDHKLSIMIGTGTYKGTTKLAYGLAYQPNYDMVFSVKGSDDSVATSFGINI